MRPASGAVSSLASAIASTGAGSATRDEPLAKHAEKMRRHPGGRTERERHAGGGQPALAQVTLVIERERQARHAESARGEPVGEIAHEPLHAEAERLDVVHGRRQVEAANENGRRHERRARIGGGAERAVDERDDGGTEAAREAVARQGGGLPERRDARLAQRVARGVGQVEEGERKRTEHVGKPRAIDDRLRESGAREKERGPRRGRDAEAIRVAQRMRAPREARHEPRQAVRRGAGSRRCRPPAHWAARGRPWA